MATFLLTVFLERYIESSAELLTDHTFSNGLESWKSRAKTDGSIVIEDGGVLHLSSSDTENYVSVWQDYETIPAAGFMKLSAMIKVDNIIHGPRGWHKARLILDRQESSGKSQKAPHHVASLDGTSDWQLYEQVFLMVPGTARMSVKAELARASGNMWIREPSLKRVSVSPLFLWIRPVTFVTWALLLVWILSSYFSGKSGITLSVLTILTIAAILVGTLAPAVSKTRVQGAAKEMMTTITSHFNLNDKEINESGDDHPYDVYIKRIEVGKIGHFLLFGIFSFLIFNAGKSVPGSIIFLDAIILAGATELLQFFTEGRTPGLFDFGLDLGGILTGLLIFRIFIRNTRKPPNRIEIPANI